MEHTQLTIPVVALRGLTVLPQMIISFDISRKKSIAAVGKAMVGDQKILLVTQKRTEEMNPQAEDLYQMGTVAMVKQLVKLPGGVIRVMAEGEERAELLSLNADGSYLEGEAEIRTTDEENLSQTEREAMPGLSRKSWRSMAVWIRRQPGRFFQICYPLQSCRNC